MRQPAAATGKRNLLGKQLLLIGPENRTRSQQAQEIETQNRRSVPESHPGVVAAFVVRKRLSVLAEAGRTPGKYASRSLINQK